MKQFVIISAIVFSIITGVKSQTINGLPLDSLKSEYIEVLLIKDGSANLDYGQKTSAKESTYRIRNAVGKNMKFNSSIALLNFIAEYGYKLITTHLDNNGYSKFAVYTLRKED